MKDETKPTVSKTRVSKPWSGRRLLAIIAILTAVLSCMEKALEVGQKLVNLFVSLG